MQLLESLGFTINIKKSVLTPRKEIKFLGFLLNSEKMTLTHERAEKMLMACKGLKNERRFTIRELAQVIGQLVAAFPGSQWVHFLQGFRKPKNQGLERKQRQL